MADERVFREQFAIDVRTRCEAIAISPEKKTVDLRNVATGEVTTESYDKLVLSPGATPISPPLPGIDLPGVFRCGPCPMSRRSASGSKGIRPSLRHGRLHGFQTVMPAQRAVVVGGGFIGLEMAENLIHLGLQVTLIQRGDQLMAPMDPEMARYVERHMEKNGIRLVLNADVNGFKQAAHGSLEVLTQIGPGLSGRPRGARHRRAPGELAGEERRAGDRRAGRHPRRRPDAHQRPGYLRRRRCRRGQRLHHRPMVDWSRWPGRPTGRAASRPT